MTRRTEWRPHAADPATGPAAGAESGADGVMDRGGSGSSRAGPEPPPRTSGGPRARRERGEPRARRSRGEPGGRGGSGEEPRDPAERARAICLRLLTGTPRTRRQLAEALAERDIPDEIAEEVLSRFEDVGLIDDAAFAGAWVESRHHGRGLARRALASELRTKGVDPALIDEAMTRLDPETEAETARELVDRRLRATRGLDRQKRIRRLAGMLARKGYGEGVALRVVREALEAEGEDVEELLDP